MTDRVLTEDINYTVAHNKELLQNFKDKHILITGATGLIAHNLILTLISANDDLQLNLQITALARNSEKAQKMYGESYTAKGLSFVYQDIKAPINLTTQVDYIFHAAAVTDSKTLIAYPIEAFETQVLGTLNILKFAQQNNAHVLYLSSMEIYGQPFVNGRATENDLGFVDPLIVRNGYPEAKRANEFLGKAFSEEHGLFVVNARLAQTFGAGTPKDDSRVFAQFIRSAINKEDIVLHTDGSSYGNYTYLRDTIEALLLLIVKGKPGESYNVTNEEANLTIKEMAELVSTNFGNGVVTIDIPKESMGYAAKTQLHLSGKKLETLGWKPTYNLKEMFARTIESFKEQ